MDRSNQNDQKKFKMFSLFSSDLITQRKQELKSLLVLEDESKFPEIDKILDEIKNEMWFNIQPGTLIHETIAKPAEEYAQISNVLRIDTILRNFKEYKLLSMIVVDLNGKKTVLNVNYNGSYVEQTVFPEDFMALLYEYERVHFKT